MWLALRTPGETPWQDNFRPLISRRPGTVRKPPAQGADSMCILSAGSRWGRF